MFEPTKWGANSNRTANRQCDCGCQCVGCMTQDHDTAVNNALDAIPAVHVEF